MLSAARLLAEWCRSLPRLYPLAAGSSAASQAFRAPPSPVAWPPATTMFGARGITCYTAPASELMCFGGPCKYIEEDWEDVDSYVSKNPILYTVPKDRFIVPKPDRPYLTTESGRQLIRSAILLPYMSHAQNASSLGLLKEGNIGVLKNLGVFGLKDVNLCEPGVLDDLLKQDAYLEVQNFLITLLRKHHGSEVLDHIPDDLTHLLNLMVAPKLDEEFIATHASLLSREARARLIMSIYQFLLREAPLRGKHGLIHEIVLNKMPYLDQNDSWVTEANGHPILKLWIARAGKSKQAAQISHPKGSGLVTLHRHAMVHASDGYVLNTIPFLNSDQRLGLWKVPHTLEDVIDLLHYDFPKYLPRTQTAFREENLWHILNMWSLFSLPTSYK